jgi:hypothetical protein
MYTDCYGIGQFRNETAERSPAKAGRDRDEVLSKRETDHDAGERCGACLSAPAKTGSPGDIYRTEETYLSELRYFLFIPFRWPGSLS